MGLEAGTFIHELNPAWPLGTDQRRYGAPHLRLIKSTIKNTWPNVNAVVSASDEEMNQLVGFDVLAINALTLSGQIAAFYRDASNLNAGVLNDARVQESNVTQHQDALVINGEQITTNVFTQVTSFAIIAGYGESIQICNSAAPIVVTLEGGVIATGDSIGFIRRGTGSVTFAGGAGQTVNKPAGLSILLQHGKAVATYVATNTWELSGNL
jgi:hypothetical protein